MVVVVVMVLLGLFRFLMMPLVLTAMMTVEVIVVFMFDSAKHVYRAAGRQQRRSGAGHDGKQYGHYGPFQIDSESFHIYIMFKL